MKKLISILPLFLLAGCAMGINHNVANINGKQYLVETKNYAVPILPIYQWSDESTFTALDGDIDEKIVSKKVAEIVKHCSKKAQKQTATREYNYEIFFDCMNNTTK